MVDVLNKVREFFDLEDEDSFLYLQILQRKKENPQLGSNSRVIKNYNISNIEYLEKRYDEIKKLCDIFNARAMLRLNKRSKRKVAFKSMELLANSLSNQEYSFSGRAYDRACGQSHNDKNKKWILDIDEPFTKESVEEIKKFINLIEPIGDKVLKELPTKSGIHLITKPFNLQHFKTEFPDISVHKDNPINLYIP